MNKLLVLSGVLAAVGVIFIALGAILGWVVVPDIIDKKIEDEAQLKNGTFIYDKWVEIPIPIYMSFYVFNVTNFEEVNKDWSTIPQLKQVGPYVYKENREKDDIRGDVNSDTVTFRPKITYTFVREMSSGPENDHVYTINTPYLSVATVFAALDEEKLDIRLKNLVLALLSASENHNLIKRVEPISDVWFGWTLPPLYRLLELTGPGLDVTFPPELKDGQFGYWLNRNGQNADGFWEVYSGIRDTSKFNTIKSIDGSSRTPDGWWNGTCGDIKGTDGSMFPPFIEKDTTLHVHSPEICRSVWLEFDDTMEYEGIPGYRFRLPKEVFTVPDEYPANECFYPSPPEGLFNENINGQGRLQTCKGGAPIVISKPHFLDADEKLYPHFKDIVTPDRDSHDTFIELEPHTGFPLRARKRMQVGVETQPLDVGFKNETVNQWMKIPQLFFPAIWIEERVDLDKENVDEIKHRLITPLKIVDIGKWTLIGVGIVLTIGGVAYFTFLKRKH